MHRIAVLMWLLLPIACRPAEAPPDRTSEQPEVTLAGAKQWWANRPFTSYNITVAGSLGSGDCIQSMQVQQERVVFLPHNTCRSAEVEPGVTVSDLFRFVEESIAQEGKCGPNGCGCDGLIRTAVEYDEEWGYPRRLRIYLDTLNAVYRREHQRYLAERRGCTDLGIVDYDFIVPDFRPMDLQHH